MRRIVVFSDSHGRIRNLQEIILRHGDADYFLHLGDGAEEAAGLRDSLAEGKLLFVKGNCDFGAEERSEDILDCDGTRIYFTHGHRYEVKNSYDKILKRARELNARVACFGHTHVALSDFRGGVHLLNPGSTDHPRMGPASYGVIDITEAGIVTRIVTL